MNDSRATLAEADIPPADPAGDQAAPGLGLKDDRDPASRKHHAAVLDRLGDIGVALAEQLPPLAKAQARLAEAVTERLRGARPEGIAALGELAVTLHKGNVDFAQMYERICRSVRRCIAMQMQVASAAPLRQKTAAGAAGRRPGAAGEPAADAGRDPGFPSERRSEAESGIAAELAGERGAERLFSDLYDRPEDLTGMADLGLDRPLTELVAEICADFGVDGRLWAERLGIGEEMTAACAPMTGKNRRNAGRGSAQGANPLGVPPDCAAPAEPGHAGGPGVPIGAGWGGRNRRERRAALKLARKPPPPAKALRPDSGRGPP